jgi:uncharacterized protein
MINYLKKVSLVVITLILVCFSSWANDKDFPAVPNPPRLVNDLASFMNANAQNTLEQKLIAYNDTTSNQIAIVTVQSIGNYDIADYTVQLFNRWHIGGKKNNNGILILASKEERKIWITTGYGLEGVLPDGLVGEIVRNEILPEFKNGDYYLGFDRGVDAIIKAAAGEYKADPKALNEHKGPSPIIIVIIMIILIVAVTRGSGGGGRGGRGGGMLTDMGWIAASMLNANRRSGGFGGGFGGGGGGGFGGGGFGGFGGGSSGGGGAGGSW